jgi:putative inorganic carbon (HCO3(-)) transporter
MCSEMNSLREEIPAWLVGAAAVSAVASIAAMEILMGAAVLALIGTRAQWKVPAVWIPFAVFGVLTFVSAAASGHFREGMPQAKKLVLYVMIALVPTAFCSVSRIRWIAIGWTVAAAASSAWALNQFYNKYEDAVDAHANFYNAYVAQRITGFMGHWMTFAGEMMLALMILGALLFFTPIGRWTGWLAGAGALITAALIANETRGVWFATVLGAVYLIWHWRRWMLLAVPAVVGLVLLMNPFDIGKRVVSAFQPNGELDSNQHRTITRAIGWQMIKAHPWLGIGPERIGKEYLNYLPPGMHQPLPSGYYGHLHNNYVHFAAELGVPAMLALMAIFARALYDFVRALRRSRVEHRWILHGAIAAIIAMMAGGYFEKNLGDSEVLVMFLAVIGCGYAAVMEKENECPS